MAEIKQFERVYFHDRHEVFAFVDNLRIEVESFCKRHPRCKPMSLSISDPKDHVAYKSKFDDISISISELFYGHFLEGKEVGNV